MDRGRLRRAGLRLGQDPGQVNERLPALFDEIRSHTDMLIEAMHQLPPMGNPDQPLLVLYELTGKNARDL